MARTLIHRITLISNQIKHMMGVIFGNNYPGIEFIGITHHEDNIPKSILYPKELSGLKDIDNGFMWAVPKTRRSIETRLSRKFGYKEYFWKMLEPKKHLRTCLCGHSYEPGHLCNNCYSKVKAETEEMQKAIVNNLGLEPVENDVVVLYEGEKNAKSNYWKGQRIIELPKKRPSWFHSNLLQPTTQGNSDQTEVKST